MCVIIFLHVQPARLKNSLAVKYFYPTFDLNGFKSRITRRLFRLCHESCVMAPACGHLQTDLFKLCNLSILCTKLCRGIFSSLFHSNALIFYKMKIRSSQHT